jgi:hypothetical protein
VSRPWREEVAIYVAPRRLALVRLARGLRRRVVAATELAVHPGVGNEVERALARLAEVLTEPTWQGADVRAVVADPWVRYGIVPWPGARLDGAGRLTHARYVLADAYGEAVSDWAVTLADTPPGHSYVACAMPSSLRGALEETVSRAGLRLVSLQPQLVFAFNAWRHRLPPDDAWFVSVDDGSLCAVHLRQGAWDRIHMARLSPDWRVELERLQAFTRLTRGAVGVGRIYVDAPAWLRRGAEPGPGIEWLEEREGDGTEPHDLALLQRGYS